MLYIEETAEQKANKYVAFPKCINNPKVEEKPYKVFRKKNFKGKTAILNDAYKT